MLNFPADPSQKCDFELFPRSFSYAPRMFQVCFGSDLRLSCASVGSILRSLVIVHVHKYTKVVFNLSRNFFHTVLITCVLSRTHTLSLCHFITLSLRVLCVRRGGSLCHSVTLLLCHFVTQNRAQPLRLEVLKQAGGIQNSPDSINKLFS